MLPLSPVVRHQTSPLRRICWGTDRLWYYLRNLHQLRQVQHQSQLFFPQTHHLHKLPHALRSHQKSKDLNLDSSDVRLHWHLYVLFFNMNLHFLLTWCPSLKTPGAVARLQALLTGPHPQLIRIGVRNKGCAGMSYHLEYVDKPGMFDEIVEQDGVRVLIDSKALFSIIGSEMDWVEDRMRCVLLHITYVIPSNLLLFSLSSAKFAFRNPNVKDACGCGESFSLGPMQS